jgi:hypothetical protein
MKINYYKYGFRPVYEEKEENYTTFYAFQWDTGEFKEDMTYFLKIYHDVSNEREDLTKQEFEAYVKKIKEERGLL